MEHGCANLTEAVRSVQLFKIDGYSATTGMSNSDYIKSRWSVDGHEFEVHFYPNYGHSSYYSSWVALKLTLLSEPRRNKLREVPLPLPSSDLQQHLAELLRGQRGADVTFVLDSGERFPAHKNILAARSPVFMAEFFGHMDERRSQSVRIEDMEAAVFKVMLHFIYTDIVPELDAEPEAAAAMAQHLLAAADRYGLDRLKMICEVKLSGGIDVDTAATTLALAEQHNCSLLKSKCVEFIARSPETLDAVLATDGYRHLVESCPLVLTELLRAAHGRRN
ncbi:unnamed protein product [Urochloa decumbens]|uniref:BTB domain-containing protein n=1 Tax=Urochloa decumbens TaxID=240449 RepID=A0ABC9DLC7_9POAL